MAPDAVLYDIVGGEHQGWPAIREFFAKGIERVARPRAHPRRVLGERQRRRPALGDDGHGARRVAWAPRRKGKQWRSEGMTWLVFDGDTVVREVDYHDSGAVPKSLGLTAQATGVEAASRR